MPEKKKDLVVFITFRDNPCAECGEELSRGRWITLTAERGPVCLSCSDLAHLVFLPSGDAAMTRRAKKHSRLWAVVVKFSRARRRNERQGLLVEEAALAQAEQECLDDADARARQRERAEGRRAELDQAYVATFAEAVRARYPGCPPGHDVQIAEHACLKHSGRIGRTADAKALGGGAIDLAVRAHVRHNETDYDELLSRGIERFDARDRVAAQVKGVLARWR